MAITATGVRLKVAREPYRHLGWLALRVTFGSLLLGVAWVAVQLAMLPNVGPNGATSDYVTYMAAAHRWLDGGSFYQPYQLSGPYTVDVVEMMYPPTILPLLVVFSFLPAVMWWLIPSAILMGVLAYWRPSLLGWTLIVACVASPFTFYVYAFGNSAMWFVAFLGLGTIYGWPSVLVLVKPTLAPFALVGIRHRSWWLAFGIVVAGSIVFLPLWLDYLTALTNARGPLVGMLYSLPQVPLMLIPLIARWQSGRFPAYEEAPVSAFRAWPSRIADGRRVRVEGDERAGVDGRMLKVRR